MDDTFEGDVIRTNQPSHSLIRQTTIDELAETETALAKQAEKERRETRDNKLAWSYLRFRFPNATKNKQKGEILPSLSEKEFKLLVMKAEFSKLIAYASMGCAFVSLASILISPFVVGITLGDLFGVWPGIISGALSGSISFGLLMLFIWLAQTFGMGIGKKN